MNKKNEEKTTAALREKDSWLEEYVQIKLFRDDRDYTDDVFVCINGENCNIRRGDWVRVKRKFALLLEQSQLQDIKTAEMMQRRSDDFEAQTRSRRI